MGTRKTFQKRPVGRGLGSGVVVEASETVQMTSKPEELIRPRDELGGCPRCWPGGVRRRGGVILVCGSCMEREKASVDTRPSGVAGHTGRERERAEAETEGIEYRSRRLPADRPVVAVKLLLAGVGVEPRGRLTRDVQFDQPGPGPGRKREEYAKA